MPESKQNESQNEEPGTESWLRRENEYLIVINQIQHEQILQLRKMLSIHLPKEVIERVPAFNN